jgi:hypothetical protein
MAISGALHIGPGALNAVDSTAQVAVGTKAIDAAGNEYVYMDGVASCILGSWVTYDEDYATTLLAADAIGPVAVAMGAIVADKYGWFQIWGEATGATADDVADNANLYATATAGKVDDAVVAGDRVRGAISRAAGTGATTITVQLFYPCVTDIAD